MAAPFDHLQWKSRILLFFGTSERTAQQTERLRAQTDDLVDRRLLVLIVDDEVTSLDGRKMAHLPDADELRRTYGVAETASFVAVLIGLDGAEKWRSIVPVGSEQILGVIDAMPMRRNR